MSNEPNAAADRWVGRAGKSLAMLAATALVFAAAVQQARAQGSERTGKEVVEAVCIACHGTGANGAPKIGDDKAWAARTNRGLTGLTQSALNGIRKMPPHGGSPGLSDGEIERAIIFMVNASGGQWTEPLSRAAVSAERTGPQIVQAYCSKCHATGEGGAPRIGDLPAWVPRAKGGFGMLIRSAINGHGGMPPRGGVANLTDSEIGSAIGYMLYPAVPVATAPAAAPVRPDPNHQIIGGMEIYFGATSAESLRKQYPATGPESAMHGGIPRGSDYYHVNISLFDVETRDPIADAHVEIKVVDPVMGDQTRTLEPMVFNKTVSYGNYFQLHGNSPRTIVALIRRTSSDRLIEARFVFAR